jgi:hypothetical protein
MGGTGAMTRERTRRRMYLWKLGKKAIIRVKLYAGFLLRNRPFVCKEMQVSYQPEQEELDWR